MKTLSSLGRGRLLQVLALFVLCHASLAQPYAIISDIPDMQFPVTQLTISTNFTVGDTGWPAEFLTLSADSSNTNFVRNEDIVFSGTGSNRTITITRLSDHFGTNTVTVTVTAPSGFANHDSFNLKVAYFTLAPAYFGLAGVAGAAAADYNNDGFLDVLIGHNLFWNNGDTTYSNVFSFPSTHEASSSWGDLNNDGKLEPIIPSGYAPMRLYLNNGNGTFATVLSNGLPPGLDGIAAWGDFDNDGHTDLFLAGSTNVNITGQNLARVYRNNGNGTFTDVGAILPGVELCSVSWGDYDNDGWLDFAMLGGYAGLGTNVTKIYRNNHDGTFTDIQAGLPQVMSGAVAWGDYDNDGYLDLLVTGNLGTTFSAGPGLTRVYHNNGNGTFTDINAGLPPLFASSAAWGDFDNDGYLDIVLSGRNVGSRMITGVYKNNGDGTFTDIQAVLPGMFAGFSEWGEHNNDGRLDLLLSWDGPAQVYLNNTSFTNSPPSAPTDLAAAILPHNNVWLTWAPASDDQTTNSAGLYYNIRVGTTPGGIQVFSPASDLLTGRRRLYNFGNAGHTNRWFVSNLTRGTYYWSVQAIDTGLEGGPFAVESSFTITNDLDTASNHPPVAYSQSVTLAEDTTADITLTASDADGDSLTWSILRLPAHGALRGVAPNLTYIPVTNYFGSDSFDFRVRDGLAVSPSVTVTLNVNPVVDVPNLTVSCITAGSGYVYVTVTGEPYQGYALLSSIDLINWSTLYAYTTSVSQVGYFLRTTNYQFFRAQRIP